jgi:tRNA/rRNA methyltransferase
MQKSAHKENTQHLLDNIGIVLVDPKYPENIGAAARCAVNMGISRLVIVRNDEPDRDKMLKLATHKAAHLIENLKRFTSLEEALASFSHVVGTTARQGRKRPIENSPRHMMDTLLPLLENNRTALLFGPENRGLTNEDLKYCQTRVTIPTSDFSSLNLAQAVAILSYELYWGIMYSGKVIQSSPALASSHELEGMYGHVEKLLSQIGFLRTEDSSYWIRNIRNFLGRVELRAKEARIIRGFCRQFLWYDTERKKQGRNEPVPEDPGVIPDAGSNGKEKKLVKQKITVEKFHENRSR